MPAVPLEDVLCLVAAAPSITHLPGDLFPPLETAESDFQIKGSVPCFVSQEVVEVPACIFGDPLGLRTIVVLGDSHAYMWLPAFDQIGKRKHWKVIMLAKSGCSPIYLALFNFEKRIPFVECDRWHDYSIARINQTKPDLVALISTSGYRDAQNKVIKSVDWELAMAKTINLIELPNAKKVLFANLPRPMLGHPPSQFSGPNCLAAHLSDIQACSMLRDEAIALTTQPEEREVAAQTGVHYIDINPWVCSAQTCTTVIGRMVVYVRNGHLSMTYATYLSGALQSELQPIMDAP